MRREFDSVSVIGLGYIGLPTAAVIASKGINVVGVDVNEQVVEAINAARSHFSEPDLDGLVHSTVSNGLLKAYSTPQPADAFIIAVPTPVQPNKTPDLSFVEAAIRSVSKVLKKGDLVILESTSPVGTTRWLAGVIREERPDLSAGDDLSVLVAYCPERILPGRMIVELLENDRIVGGTSGRASARAKALYETFVRGRIYETSSGTAELVKIIENAYRDVNIAFANEVASVCERMDMDAWEAIGLANKHPRVNILNPGPGVGGHCIAVDPWFVIAQHPDLTPLMQAARKVNDGRPHTVIAKIREAAHTLGSRKICCLGLAYKSDVDDLRESPALAIVRQLADEGFEIAIVEPNIDTLPGDLEHKAHVTLSDVSAAIVNADIVVALVAHRAFGGITPEQISGKAVIDSAGLWRNANTRSGPTAGKQQVN